MKQIFVISAFFVVIILAIVGTMSIFDVLASDAATSIAVKSTAAIVLLGVCAAAIKLLVSGRKDQED